MVCSTWLYSHQYQLVTIGKYPHSRINLDKVITILLINQKLRGSCIPVANAFGQLDGICQNGIASRSRKVLCRCQLHDLLMTSLHRAVTLKEMHHISVAITEQLDFNMPGFV